MPTAGVSGHSKGGHAQLFDIDDAADARVPQHQRLVALSFVAKDDGRELRGEEAEPEPQEVQHLRVRRASVRDDQGVRSGVRVEFPHGRVRDGARDEEVRSSAQNVLVSHFQGDIGRSEDDALRVNYGR